MTKQKRENKGFSIETLRRVARGLRAGIKYYTALLNAGEKLAAIISDGNEKIGHVINVSLAPILTCGNCKACIRFCYAIRDIYSHGYDFIKHAVMRARCINTALFWYDRDAFFKQIADYIESLPESVPHLFRWHVAGEIVDYDHFDRLVKFALAHSNWYFWSYTKMHTIVNVWIDKNGSLPDNFCMMFSWWDNETIYNPHNLPVFHSVPAEKISGEKWTCPGNCDECKPGKRGCIGKESVECAIH